MSPVTVNGIKGAIGVAAGDGHTCALMANRTVECWGSNVSGQLGYGAVTNYSLKPVQVSELIAVTAISAGSGYSCAVVVSGEVQCWGSNADATLGERYDGGFVDAGDGARDNQRGRCLYRATIMPASPLPTIPLVVGDATVTGSSATGM